MLMSRGLHALLWSPLALAATQDLPSAPRRESNVGTRSEFIRQPDTSRDLQRRNVAPKQARLESAWTLRLESGQAEQCSESTFCPDGARSFQCCGEGFQCCLAEDGAGSCCEGDCEGEGCSSDP